MLQPLVLRRRTFEYGYWATLAVLTLAGVGALGYRFAVGLQVTNLGSVVPWGFWISFYILFIGLSAGSFLLSTLIYVFGLQQFERIGRLAVFSAAVCLVMGMLFVLIDLGRVERFWHVFGQISQSSVMWYEIMLYNVYVAILVAELWFLTRTDLIRLRDRSTGPARRFYGALALGSQSLDEPSQARDMRVVRILGIIGLPTAIAVHGGTGAIFAVLKAVPYWYSPLLPIVFITSALASGAGLLLFFRAFFGRAEPGEEDFLATLARLALGLLFIDWIMVIFELLVGLYGDIPDHREAIREMTLGDKWWVFWLLQLGVGVVVPTAIIASQRSRAWLGLAGLAIVLGIIGVRWNIVVPGLTVPKLEGLTEAVRSSRIVAFYSPSWVEWVTTIGLLALFMLLLSLGNKFLPLQAEHVADSSEEAR